MSNRATKLQVPVLAGWRTPYSFLGTPLVAEGGERVLPDCSLDGLRGKLTGVALLDQMSAGERRLAVPRGRDRAGVTWWRWPGATSTARPSRPSGSGTSCRSPARRRADLRRTRRRLEERLGGEVEFVHGSSRTTRRSRQFLALEASGWKGEAGTALRRRATHARFFTEMCRRFARPGRLELMAMSLRGPDAGHGHDAQARDCRYAFKIAFDEEFRKQAPGTQLIVELAENPPRRAAALLDSCSDSGQRAR